MKIIGTVLFFALSLQLNAFDLKNLGFTIDMQMLWRVNSFNDTKRMYTFRQRLDGTKRELNSLESIGIGYTHITEGGLLLIPSLKIGRYGPQDTQSKCFAFGFTLAKYHFQSHARYINISIQKEFGNATGGSISCGVLSKIWEKPGEDLTHLRLGIGLSAMHFNGFTATGIQFKFHCWQFGFLSP